MKSRAADSDVVMMSACPGRLSAAIQDGQTALSIAIATGKRAETVADYLEVRAV
jgi:uncharacterized protein YcgI (DUF1989 family)